MRVEQDSLESPTEILLTTRAQQQTIYAQPHGKGGVAIVTWCFTRMGTNGTASENPKRARTLEITPLDNFP